MEPFTKVCSKKDLVNGRYLTIVDGKAIAIFEIGNKLFALSNVCAHLGGPIVDGQIDNDGNIVCPWHGYRFDLKTGKAAKGAPEKIEAYSIKVEAGEIYVSTNPISERTQEGEEAEFVPETPKKQESAEFEWKCVICLDECRGILPPENCAKCRAPIELIQEKTKVTQLLQVEITTKPTYAIEETAVAEYLSMGIKRGDFSARRIDIWRSIAQQPPIDVLIISASAHPHHIVSGYIAPKIIQHLKQVHPSVKYDWIELSKYKIEHNWACYSLADDFCRFPCNNMDDDMRLIYPKLVRAKSLMIVTPINWEGMNSRLKVFLDRLTNMQDVGLKVERVDWAGRPVGIFVNGHEDGAYKVAWDVFVVLQNLGYVLPPFGIWYHLSNLSEDTKGDLSKIRGNDLAINRLNKVVDNVVHFMQLRVDKQLAWELEGEKLRRVHYVAM